MLVGLEGELKAHFICLLCDIRKDEYLMKYKYLLKKFINFDIKEI